MHFDLAYPFNTCIRVTEPDDFVVKRFVFLETGQVIADVCICTVIEAKVIVKIVFGGSAESEF